MSRWTPRKLQLPSGPAAAGPHPASRSARGGGAGLSSAERRELDASPGSSPTVAGSAASSAAFRLCVRIQRPSLTQREDGGPCVRRVVLGLRGGERGGIAADARGACARGRRAGR